MGRGRAEKAKKAAGIKVPNRKSKTSKCYVEGKARYRKTVHIGRPLPRKHVNRTTLKAKLARELGLPPDTVFVFRYSLKDRPDLGPYKPIEIKEGTVVVVDKKTMNVVLIVRCNPFAEMEEELKEKFAHSISTTYLHARARNNCKLHNSIQGIKDDKSYTGFMGCCGWRGGCEKCKSAGVYSISSFASATDERIESDRERMEQFQRIRDFWAERFGSLSMFVFQSNLDLASEADVPGFHDVKWQYTQNGKVFASNLVVTCDGFYNEAHVDHDRTRYSFGMFCLANRKTGRPHEKGKENNLGDSKGSTFRVKEYGIFVPFYLCEGVVEMIWDTTIPHYTTESQSFKPDGSVTKHKLCQVTRYGSSCQISESLVQRIQFLSEKKKTMGEEEWLKYCQTRVKSYEEEVQKKKEKNSDKKKESD